MSGHPRGVANTYCLFGHVCPSLSTHPYTKETPAQNRLQNPTPSGYNSDHPYAIATHLHITPSIPSANPHAESECNDDYGSEQESAYDLLLMEESQHLITGFANCIERAKWLQLPVVVEPPFLLKTPPHETTPILQGIIGLLETKIAPANMNTIIPGTSLSGWKFLSNSSASSTCRILVGWEPIAFDLSCLQFSEQWVTCEVTSLATKDKLKITFVYGLNTWAGRGLLRSYIKQHASLYSDTWVHLRDFNAITVL
ncbi:hypothetical protein H0E87_018257 [Populus deltoides]|uniref:Uncharacterized protein n=1 Tax=Populus deltoides TaxID=3696 RepID=A0A8T2XPJ5_POPDE|nr:hypothetical protein H0E87_018257 [Populus deltoides]